MSDRIQEWKNSTWQLMPTIEMPELDPEVVQFAVLDSDPIEDYRKLLYESKARYMRELAERREPSQRESLARAQISGTWDRLFHTTPGDQIYLLTSSRSRADESRVWKTIISSNVPDGQRWLTTRTTDFGGRPICWCIPFDATTGTSVEIKLRRENLFDLQKEYRQCIEEG